MQAGFAHPLPQPTQPEHHPTLVLLHQAQARAGQDREHDQDDQDGEDHVHG